MEFSRAAVKDTNTPTTGAKRAHAPAFDDSDEDSENIDPLAFTPKKSKSSNGSDLKKSKFNFHMSVRSDSKVNNPFLSSLDTKTTLTPPVCTTPTSTLSAPAGRSLPNKRVSALSKKRTSLSPYSRIDPPTFVSPKKSSSSRASLPFSIDAALHGTVSNDSKGIPLTPTVAGVLNESHRKPMPKSWQFEIYEDSPEEEAATIMQHSTCTLDISSDEEGNPCSWKDERGKENVPPSDYDAVRPHGIPAGPESRISTKPRLSRGATKADVMTDERDDMRSPLNTLPVEQFYDDGLDSTSVEVIKGDTDARAVEQPEAEVTAGEQEQPPTSDAFADVNPEDTQTAGPAAQADGAPAEFTIAIDQAEKEA